MLHFKLKVHQKSFVGQAVPGLARGAYSAPSSPIWIKGKGEATEGEEGKGKEEGVRKGGEGRANPSNINGLQAWAIMHKSTAKTRLTNRTVINRKCLLPRKTTSNNKQNQVNHIYYK